MGQTDLFPAVESVEGSETETEGGTGKPRLREANRKQVAFQAFDLEQLIPPEHPARTLWAAVERLDLSRFHRAIAAREGRAGRDATDPKILVCLWLFATAEGIGSARELDRMCKEHVAYRWICGGVTVNYHLLAEFRVGHTDALDALLVDILGRLFEAGLVTLRRVAHDGMRVRAAAGASSFRRKDPLKRAFREARRQVEHCKAQLENPTLLDQRKAAELRAAEDRQARLERALKKMKVLEKARANDPNVSRRAKETRVSTTDPDARVMKMPDGGFRPAYNVQLSTDVDSRVIVGVRVTDSGVDSPELIPTIDHLEDTFGTAPEELLVDAGYVSLDGIAEAEQRDVRIYAPVPQRNVDTCDPHEPKPNDPVGVADWRQRMATDDAKAIYKERASTAETTNADLREHRGLDRFNVRGPTKVLSVTLWGAIAYNLLRVPLEALSLWS